MLSSVQPEHHCCAQRRCHVFTRVRPRLLVAVLLTSLACAPLGPAARAGAARVNASRAAGNTATCPWSPNGYAAYDTCWGTSTPLRVQEGAFNLNTNSTPSNTWLGSMLAGYVSSDDPAGRGGFVQTLWAPHCALGAQSVHFTLRRLLPGVPAELHLTLGARPARGLPNPVTAVSFLINGHRVYQTGVTAHRITLDAAARTLLHFGFNTFELSARKAPSPPTTCGASLAQFGVFAELWGRYVADIAVTEAPVVRSSHCCVYRYTIVNHGPSVVLRGQTFSWTIGTSKLDTSFGLTMVDTPNIFTNPEGYRGCTRGTSTANGFGLDCETTRPLGAGQTIHVLILFPYGPPPSGPFVDKWRTTWRFPGWNDPTPQDDTGSAAHGFCSPSSSCSS
jgi:hypothetical protein